MFIDSTAIVAILNDDPDAEQIARRIEDYPRARFVSPIVRLEAVEAVARARSHGTASMQQLETAREAVTALIHAFAAQEITITPTIAARALEAMQTYGAIVGHPARLNLGGCFAHACASAYNCRVIYKGDRYAGTDLA